MPSLSTASKNGHARALVPLTSAPTGTSDVGLFAQALIHYDRVSLLVMQVEPLESLLEWFVAPGEIETFLIWVRDGIIDFADAGLAEDPRPFRERMLDHPRIVALMKGQYRHSRLLSFSADRVSAVEAGEGDAAGRALRIALRMGVDLYSGVPISAVAADGLAGGRQLVRFEGQAIFPPVRSLVNAGRMDLREVIDLRRRSRVLREWLQGGHRMEPEVFFGLHDAAGRQFVGSTARTIRWYELAGEGVTTLLFDAS